jgi:hypothetical protein
LLGHLAEFSLLESLLLVFPDGALFCFVADVMAAGNRRSVEAPGYDADLSTTEPASDDPRHVGQATGAAGRWVLWAGGRVVRWAGRG